MRHGATEANPILLGGMSECICNGAAGHGLRFSLHRRYVQPPEGLKKAPVRLTGASDHLFDDPVPEPASVACVEVL